MKNEFIEYQLVIKPKGRIKDINTFNRWADGVININECFNEFMTNNGYKYDYYISDYDTPFTVSRVKFKYWLNSLGYYRDKKDVEVNFYGKTKKQNSN